MSSAGTDGTASPAETVVYEYETGGDGGSRLWVGDGETDEFSFSLTNLAVRVEGTGVDDVAVPLGKLEKVRTTTTEELSPGVARALQLTSLVVGLLILGGSVAVALTESIVRAVFVGGFWAVVYLWIGNKVEGALEGEYRWIEFVLSDHDPSGTLALGYVRPDNRQGSLRVKLPERSFGLSEMDQLPDSSPLNLDDDFAVFAPFKELFDRLGYEVLLPKKVSLTDDSGSASGEGGPVGVGEYVCENCGRTLDGSFDVSGTGAGRDYECGHCGHVLDDQKGASNARFEADAAWDDVWDDW